MLRAIWTHREFVRGLVAREFQVRSVRRLWGMAWIVIQPAVLIFIYTLIFSEVLRAKLPGVDDSFAYGIYICAGLLSWNAFTDLVQRCQNLFVNHADLIKAVDFPRSCLVASALISTTISFLIVAVLFFVVLALLGRFPGVELLAGIALYLTQVCLALGIGLIAGALQVFYRDVSEALSVVLQFWFWLTPIVYPASLIPERFQAWLEFNPMYHIVSGYQAIVINGSAPAWEPLAVVLGMSAGLCLVAMWVVRRLWSELIEEL